MDPAKALREAAANAGYTRDEVIRIGRAYSNPLCTHLKLVESKCRQWPLAYRDTDTGTLIVWTTAN